MSGPSESLGACSLADNDQEELLKILDDFVERIQRGETVDVEAMVQDRPDLADPLRGCLDSLLFLQRAAPDVAALHDDLRAQHAWSSGRLGEFEILREIGRGGMGVVFEATQVPLGRRVALKVLPFAAVLDQKQTARFLVEAQAAAQLHHPHIVPVYSVGCEQGVHYYSMQYIEGQSLEVALDQLRAFARRPAPTNGSTSEDDPGSAAEGFCTSRSSHNRDYILAVVRLGIQAAEALQHAHDFGVIHRDIKPSNLLVDRSGKLWITDFGLARCQAESSLTRTGAVIGTVQYMSPEQAMGRTRLVDHRTDVYSLGITLYELLTLHPAFAARERQAFLKQIERHEPMKLRSINGAIPADLQTIIFKAVSKRRADRYPTAQDFADDLRRFECGVPIQARPPSLRDRVGKWAARHQAIVASTLCLLVAALVGTTVVALLMARQAAATRRALETAEVHLLRADENFRQARDVVEHFGLLAAEKLSDVPGSEDLRGELLNDTLAYYQSFIQQAGDDPRLRVDLAVTYFKTAELYERLGDHDQALATFQTARRLFEELGDAAQAEGEASSHLAMCYNNIGLLFGRKGQTVEARSAYEQAVVLQQELVRSRPNHMDWQQELALLFNNLGLLCSETGEEQEADRYYTHAVQIQRELAGRQPDDAELRYDLAMTLNNMSCRGTDLARSLDLSGQSLALLRALSETNDEQQRFAADLALGLNNRASLLIRDGQPDAARALLVEAVQVYEQLAAQSPAVAKYRLNLAVASNNLGRCLNQLRDYDAAEQALSHACAVLQQLVEQYPQAVQYRSSLGGAWNNLGVAHERRGQMSAAQSAYQSAVRHQQLAYEQAADLVQIRRYLAHSYDNLERILIAQGARHKAANILAARKELDSTTADLTGSNEP